MNPFKTARLRHVPGGLFLEAGLLSVVLAVIPCTVLWGKKSDRPDITTRTLAYHRPGIYIEIAEAQVTGKSVHHRREVNARLARLAKEMRDEFVESYTEYWQQLGGYTPDQTSLNATAVVDTYYVNDVLLSIRFAFDIYSGGAHPNGTYESLTFDLSGDTVRQLSLDDLFPESARVDSVMADEIVSQVMESQRGDSVGRLFWNQEELRESLVGYGIGSFVVGADGIDVATWPGPHVMGPVSGLISYEVLDPFIPSGGILDTLLRRHKDR